MKMNELQMKAMAAIVKALPHVVVSATFEEIGEGVWLSVTLTSHKWTKPDRQRGCVKVLVKGKERLGRPAASEEEVLTLLLDECAYLNRNATTEIPGMQTWWIGE